MRATSLRRAAITLALVLGCAATAGAQIEIWAGDNVNFKLGILGQFQADTVDDPPGDANTNNLFIRRLRLMFAGQVTERVTFFVETDSPNLGKAVPAGNRAAPPEFIVPSTELLASAILCRQL